MKNYINFEAAIGIKWKGVLSVKILVAGASGVIGRPLIEILIHFGFEVYGMTRTEKHAGIISARGARPFIVDVLDKQAVVNVFEVVRPEVVINMLSSLPEEYTPETMAKAAKEDAKVRLKGGGNLLEAAKNFGAKRYIVQSCGFWYEQGEGLADEYTPFAFEATAGISSGSRLYAEIERQAFQEEKVEAVILRFGFFYGSGTWFHPDGSIGRQIRKQEFPLVGSGGGVWNFIHVEDGAKAIAAAIYCQTGTYNIVNNHPLKIGEWLPDFSRYMESPYPPEISEEEGLLVKGEDFVYYSTKLRGASNLKAKRELDFQPRTLEWALH